MVNFPIKQTNQYHVCKRLTFMMMMMTVMMILLMWFSCHLFILENVFANVIFILKQLFCVLCYFEVATNIIGRFLKKHVAIVVNNSGNNCCTHKLSQKQQKKTYYQHFDYICLYVYELTFTPTYPPMSLCDWLTDSEQLKCCFCLISNF